MKDLLNVFSCIILSFLFLCCAGQFSPPGGPPDTTPPEIMLSTPPPGTLNFHGNTITLHFSKYVERRSVEESIFLSPPLNKVSFDWSGKDVDVHFSDSLRQNITYIMTVGTDVIDTRNNKMAQAYALAFSTGEHIDSAMVRGTVSDEKSSGIMIFAYQLDGREHDTLNPSHLKPDYVTQTGKDGSFLLSNLALGTYRLFAIRDTYKNLLYDPQTDQYGTTPFDVHLTGAHPLAAGIQFQMTSEDTTPPFLSSARALSRNRILLRFSEAMDSSTLSLKNISVVDTVNHSQLMLVDLSFIESLLEAQVLTGDQDSGKEYRVMVHDCKDLRGNLINVSVGNGDFTGGTVRDTVKLSVRFEGLPDSAKNVSADDSLKFLFTSPVQRAAFEQGFHLQDASRNIIEGKFLWWNASVASFIPGVPLVYGNWYTARIVLDSVVDLSGKRIQLRRQDSTLTRRFKIVDESTLSSVAGTVIDDSSGALGKIHLIARGVSAKNNSSATIVISQPGSFLFPHLLEGTYTLYAFRDADSNGVYTYGKLFPFQPSERFVVYPDTLKVRARWPLEGVAIRFK